MQTTIIAEKTVLEAANLLIPMNEEYRQELRSLASRAAEQTSKILNEEAEPSLLTAGLQTAWQDLAAGLADFLPSDAAMSLASSLLTIILRQEGHAEGLDSLLANQRLH